MSNWQLFAHVVRRRKHLRRNYLFQIVFIRISNTVYINTVAGFFYINYIKHFSAIFQFIIIKDDFRIIVCLADSECKCYNILLFVRSRRY